MGARVLWSGVSEARQHALENGFEPGSEERELKNSIAEVHTRFSLGCADTRESERNATRGPENDRLRFLRPPSNSNAERSSDHNG